MGKKVTCITESVKRVGWEQTPKVTGDITQSPGCGAKTAGVQLRTLGKDSVDTVDVRTLWGVNRKRCKSLPVAEEVDSFSIFH